MNEAIRVREVRAIFPDGTVEVMPTSAAVRKAQDMGLDLILIAPTAEPPVAKAMDYGQWQYENKKKQHDARKKQHIIQVKELKFRPNTDDHDYEFKKNHAIRFLKEGNRVKAVVQFRGREIAHVDLGKKLLLRFAGDLATTAPWKVSRAWKDATRTCSSARPRPRKSRPAAAKAASRRQARPATPSRLIPQPCGAGPCPAFH